MAMEPALQCGTPEIGCEGSSNDRILVRRFRPGEDPGRGDVIVFDTPDAAVERCRAGVVFVKRIVGLPGEVVVERAGVIRIDGRALDEPYVRPTNRGTHAGGLRVPEGEYFVLGDNRPQSCDGRVWGGVPRDDVVDKVVVRYWPPGRMGRLR